MKAVLDTDILSIFARIRRLDILNLSFEQIIVPQSVIAELGRTEIKIGGLKHEVARLTREELVALKGADARLGTGERECLVIAEQRSIPLASNDRIVHSLCRIAGVGYFTLPRLLRYAILKGAITRQQVRELVRLIEREERTVIKGKDEIFK